MTIALHMQLDELPTACWDLLCNLCFSPGKAQRHNGTKAQGFDCIVGKMHGWTYFEILCYFSDERHNGITAQRHFNVYRYYTCVCMYESSYVYR